MFSFRTARAFLWRWFTFKEYLAMSGLLPPAEGTSSLENSTCLILLTSHTFQNKRVSNDLVHAKWFVPYAHVRNKGVLCIFISECWIGLLNFLAGLHHQVTTWLGQGVSRAKLAARLHHARRQERMSWACAPFSRRFKRPLKCYN